MGGSLVLLYGTVAYVLFLGTFLYSVGFVSGQFVPKGIDDGPLVPTGEALALDLLLMGLFAVQHSVMARRGFKERWTTLVPQPIERSTFVLATSVVLMLLFWAWRPLPGLVWSVEHPVAVAALQGLHVAGWIVVLLSTFLIDHFDLFGLRQVVLAWRGRAYEPPHYVERGFYRFVRHPLLLGFMIAFWTAPVMSSGRLLFAAVTTAYMLVAIQLEERDLLAQHGEAYADYRRRVSMLLPGRRAPR